MNRHVKQMMVAAAVIIFASCSKDVKDNVQLPDPQDRKETKDSTFDDPEASLARSPRHGIRRRFQLFSESVAIDASLTKFRDLLGPLNWNATQTGGRKEINWDDVVLALTNNNIFPGNYYNRTDAGGPYDRKRGIEFTTPGSGFRVSNNKFADLDPLYADEFIPYSSVKNFTSLGSNIIDIHFKEPGTSKPGYVHGFGAIFSDVNIDGTTWVALWSGKEYIGKFKVKIADTGQFSFLGIYMPHKKITRARIHLGEAALGNGTQDVCDSPTGSDLVALDDVLFSTPRRFYY
jgi:hypothetical protein